MRRRKSWTGTLIHPRYAWSLDILRPRKQHVAVIELIAALRDGPVSARDIARRVGVSHMSAFRVMSRLQVMGLLVYRPGGIHGDWKGGQGWRVTPLWPDTPELVIAAYLEYMNAPRAE